MDKVSNSYVSATKGGYTGTYEQFYSMLDQLVTDLFVHQLEQKKRRAS